MRLIQCNRCWAKKSITEYSNIRYRVCKDCAKKVCKERIKKHPERARAKEALRYAVKTGKIKRGVECSRCGDSNKRIIGHHEDYSRKLDVIWLCDLCHQKLHRANRRKGLTF